MSAYNYNEHPITDDDIHSDNNGQMNEYHGLTDKFDEEDPLYDIFRSEFIREMDITLDELDIFKL